MIKNKKSINLLFCIGLISLAFPFSSSCSSQQSQKPINPEIPNENKYELWTNSELKNNKFSTIGTNNKLDIVPSRGADDIYDADFSDGRENTNPLLGNIINEQYRKLAQISFSVNFAIGGGNYLGTAWILDYQIPNGVNVSNEGNSFNETNYPTKWYLATNTHVMDDLKTLNSPYLETNTSKKPNSSTTTVKLKRIVNPQLGTNNGSYQKSSYNNNSYETFWINMTDDNYKPYEDAPVKPIFLGFDYLNSSPDEFINNVPQPSSIPSDVKFTKTEEMADFAVFEIDFEKIDWAKSGYNSAQEYAMYFSSNYANWSYKDQFKPAPNSLLNEKNKNKNFYSLGFPQEEAIGESRNTDNVSLFINRPNNLSENKYIYGSSLVKERHYNTFKNVAGIFDLIIGSADFGYKFDPISTTVSTSGIIPYVYQGLAYTDQNGDMQVGSSGSIFVDEDNYIYGIHFASDFAAHVGINFALKCEGYNYEGKYGSYNLQPYDLINGGYSNQRSSYKDQLIKIYGTNIKTNLFPNGLN